MEWGEFQELVKTIFASSYFESYGFEFGEDQIKYTLGKKTHIFSQQEYNEILASFSHYTKCPTFIYKQNELEVLLDPLETRFLQRFRNEGFICSDDFISYKIHTPSPELIMAFFSSVSIEEFRDYVRPLQIHPVLLRFDEREDVDIGLFDMLSKAIRASVSLKIVSSDNIPIDDLKKHANAFLFSLSYNTGVIFKLVYDKSNLSINRIRIVRRNRLSFDQIQTPKLFYNSELTEQYNLALSSSDAFIQFISFYHIMEYFFDDIYKNALISSVMEILQHPGFSSKEPREISKIIDIVKNKTKVAREEFQGSELEALELTIKEYVTMSELKSALLEYDSKSISYYSSNEVSFSKGDTIDLNDLSNDKLPKKIAARIYKTRNSLVHSKSNNTRVKERGIYHPFTDEKELTKEIIKRVGK